MAFDHGLLNLPLSKRGDIDAQIDAYKAQQKCQAAAKRKANAQAKRAQIAQAKASVAALDDARAAELMQKFGITRKQLDKKLNSIAHFTPAVILRWI